MTQVLGHRLNQPKAPNAIADELATRAGLDAGWDAVLRQYLAGLHDYPAPFTARRPT